MRWRVLTAALLTGGSIVVPVSAAEAGDGRVLTFADGRIGESSGLVDLGSSMATVNDSGNRALVFVVSSATGRTIGVTDLNTDTADVEALAPAGRASVWVGDIGDNRHHRTSVSVYRVPVGPGRREAHPTRYRLVYPGGARNAESLFTDRAGRVYLITKAFAGGTVFRAPARLDSKRPNRLRPVGRVVEFATDAAMLPDGRHVIVRGPMQASVYTFPQLQRVGSFALPAQRQGEGISVGPGGRLRLSSEGVHSVVQQVSLPASVVQRMRAPAPVPSPPAASASPTAPTVTASTAPPPSGSASGSASGPSFARPTEPQGEKGFGAGRLDPWLMWSIPGVIGVGALGIGLGLRRKSE